MEQREGYKKTAIGWIPEEWDVVKFEKILVLQRGFDLPVKKRTKGEYPLIASNGIIDFHSEFKIKGPGVITGRSGTLGNVHYIENEYWPLNTTLYSKEMYDNSPKFLYYFLENCNIAKYGTGTGVPTLNRNNIHKLDVARPSLPEQKKIADILTTVDDKISFIDSRIQQTEQLKKGLMEKLLPEGIGHTEFKETEIGRIPACWKIEKLKDLCHRIFVGIATSTSEHYTNNGVPIIRNQNIKENAISADELLMISNEFNEINHSKKLKEGDVITVRTGYPGLSCVVPKEFEHTQTFTTLVSRPDKKIINPFYLSRYINSHIGKKLVLSNQAGGAQQNLNVNRLKEISIILPPIQEQEDIVKIIKMVDEKLGALQTKKSHYQILKKGLSQQLLTGQMRVKV